MAQFARPNSTVNNDGGWTSTEATLQDAINETSANDATWVEVVHAFDGVGMRPLSPVHLRARRLGDGSVEVAWIRRTRLGGDGWDGDGCRHHG